MNSMNSSWASFKEWVAAWPVGRGIRFIYRGQCESNWSLKSSWHRLSREDTLTHYWQLLPSIHDSLSTWTEKSWRLEDNDELGAFVGFLQHHGFPTPLLDWTYSPYLAAYFAFEGVHDLEPRSETVSIFAFDFQTFHGDWAWAGDWDTPNPHVSVIQTLSKGNRKQLIQQGVYTFSNVSNQGEHVDSLARMYENQHGNQRNYLVEFRLGVSEKPQAMRDLRLMGISATSLFPSTEGFCRGLKEEFFSSAVIGETPSQRMARLLVEFQQRSQSSGPSNLPDQPLLDSELLGIPLMPRDEGRPEG